VDDDGEDIDRRTFAHGVDLDEREIDGGGPVKRRS
jgi:hypothetical protein